MKVLLVFSVLLVSTVFGRRSERQNDDTNYWNRQFGGMGGYEESGNNRFGGSNNYGGPNDNQLGGPGRFGGQGGYGGSGRFGGQGGYGGSGRFGGQGGYGGSGRFGGQGGYGGSGRFGGQGGYGGSGRFGGQGGFERIGDFGDMFPGGFPGMGPGGHGHHHGRGPHLLPFMRNLTREQRQEFFQIVMNRNLTKADIKTQLQQWAINVGGNMTEILNEFEQKKQALKQLVNEEVKEILANVTSLIQRTNEIKDNMQITVSEEAEQIAELFKGQSMAVIKIVQVVGMGAYKEAMRPPTGQIPDGVIPSIQP